jgi:methyltransferase (TIGR00027 family)
LETQVQPALRLFNDPFAIALLSDSYKILSQIAQFSIVRKLIHAFLDLGVPCSRSSAVVRTRAIDDLVNDAIVHGARQLVLLGAGLDSRGCRLDKAREIAVFEVDHPATQSVKKERLQACMGKLPTNIHYVAVDFERDSLDKRLLEYGYNPTVQSVVVWEGVIDYLTESAVYSTFRVLTQLLPPSSLLIFTYTHKGALDGSKTFPGARRWQYLSRASGESFVFSFDPDALAVDLKTHLFLLQSDTSTAEIAQHYCPALGRSESGNRAYRLATAIRMNASVQGG